MKFNAWLLQENYFYTMYSQVYIYWGWNLVHMSWESTWSPAGIVVLHSSTTKTHFALVSYLNTVARRSILGGIIDWIDANMYLQLKYGWNKSVWKKLSMSLREISGRSIYIIVRNWICNTTMNLNYFSSVFRPCIYVRTVKYLLNLCNSVEQAWSLSTLDW